MRPPTMTRLVDRLQAAGLVVRRTDANDGRIVRVVATPKGIRVIEAGRERRVADREEDGENDRARPDMLAEAARILDGLDQSFRSA